MEGTEYKIKEKIREHLPEWIRLMDDYFRSNYKNYATDKYKSRISDYK